MDSRVESVEDDLDFDFCVPPHEFGKQNDLVVTAGCVADRPSSAGAKDPSLTLRSKQSDSRSSSAGSLSSTMRPGNIPSSQPPSFDIPRTQTQEPPTHHDLDFDALQTFVYPVSESTPVREYQRSIVRQALLTNLICALPTGLGKTFIASAVMLNWFRWTQNSKIIFVTPTRPLVLQQVKSFLNISGVSVNQITVFLPGYANKSQRKEQWRTKRVVFATSQTVENDLRSKLFDARSVVLLVIDEAHHATGNHTYVNLVRSLREKNDSFRILALTATPSGKFEGVQEVINNLCISKTEVRSEESLDIRQYVHSRRLKPIVVELSDEQEKLLKAASALLRPFMDELYQANILPSASAANVHHYQLLEGMRRYRGSPECKKRLPASFRKMSLASCVGPVIFAIGMLKTHGIYPFYTRLYNMREEFLQRKSKAKLMGELIKGEAFRALLQDLESMIYVNGDRAAGRDVSFVGHPKLSHVVELVTEFFMKQGADSRAIIFTSYRESAAEILWMLQNHCSFVVASLFFGQASNKGHKGMTQKEQKRLIDAFQKGEYNILIATSIAEEGLDIGQVDLIISYDQSESPIRVIQRMGRTGRQRTGNVYNLMTTTEEKKLKLASGGHKYIQNRISTNVEVGGRRLTYVPSPRIIPSQCSPEYVEVNVKPPPENAAALAKGDILEALKVVRARPKRVRKKDAEPPSRKRAAQGLGFQSALKMVEMEAGGGSESQESGSCESSLSSDASDALFEYE